MGSAAVIEVEVVFTLPTEQAVVHLELPSGATLGDAIDASGLIERYPGVAGLLMRENHVGIYGRAVSPSAVLRHHDRVEIYRNLTVDPKEARRRRVRLRSAKLAERNER